MVAFRRQEAQVLQTEALAAAVLGAASGSTEPIEACLKSYKNAALPFLEKHEEKEKDTAKKALEQWTKLVFRVKPLWQHTAAEARRLHSRMARGAARTARGEASRRKVKYRRL
jgi:hypothetical protein